MAEGLRVGGAMVKKGGQKKNALLKRLRGGRVSRTLEKA